MSQSLTCLQGWIPRSGLQYGTDLVLYEQHPSLVHSTVCVLIVVTPFAGEDCRPPAVCNSGARMDGQDGTLSWHDVEGINRLCVRVNSVFPYACNCRFAAGLVSSIKISHGYCMGITGQLNSWCSPGGRQYSGRPTHCAVRTQLLDPHADVCKPQPASACHMLPAEAVFQRI